MAESFMFEFIRDEMDRRCDEADRVSPSRDLPKGYMISQQLAEPVPIRLFRAGFGQPLEFWYTMPSGSNGTYRGWWTRSNTVQLEKAGIELSYVAETLEEAVIHVLSEIIPNLDSEEARQAALDSILTLV